MEREQLLALAESMMGMAIDNLRRDGYAAFATLNGGAAAAARDASAAEEMWPWKKKSPA